MIPLAETVLTGTEARYLQECVTPNFVSTVGPFVTRFEDLVASTTGAHHVVATNTGTRAIHVALLVVGVRPDDLVIMPSYTFIATADAVRMCGAEPWLLDVSAATWTFDPRLLEAELRSQTVQTPKGLVHRDSGRVVRAVLPVAAVGHPPGMDPLVVIASAHCLPVVLDSAPEVGATYRGQLLGAMADVSTLSFNGNKTLTAGGGGAVLVHDRLLSERVRHLATTARVGSGYDHNESGFNYRVTDIQAAVGCAQLEQVDQFVAAKGRIDTVYREAWLDTRIAAFPRANWADSARWMSGLVLPPRRFGACRRARGTPDRRRSGRPLVLEANASPETVREFTSKYDGGLGWLKATRRESPLQHIAVEGGSGHGRASGESNSGHRVRTGSSRGR